jgi:hypothetical protein
MDKLLKQALADDAVGFISRLKGKMSAIYSDSHAEITQKVAADMAGVEVQERLDKSDLEAAEKAVAKAQSNYEIAKKKPNLDPKQAGITLSKAEANLKMVKSKVEFPG